jgi:hypothetical protein
MYNNRCLPKIYFTFFQPNIIITLILINFVIIFNNSYAVEDKPDESLSTIQIAYNKNLNNFYQSSNCFKEGIKDCIDLILPASFSIILIIILAEHNLISYTGFKKIPLIDLYVDNFVSFIFFSFIFPVFENLLSHSIGYSYIEKLLTTIIPANFSNARLNNKMIALKDYNLPLIDNKINNLQTKIAKEAKIKPHETTMTVELLSKLTLAYAYLKFYIFNQQIVSGLIKAKHVIYRTDHYKHEGYHGAVLYQSGFTSCLYLCMAIVFMGARFINS